MHATTNRSSGRLHLDVGHRHILHQSKLHYHRLLRHWQHTIHDVYTHDMYIHKIHRNRDKKQSTMAKVLCGVPQGTLYQQDWDGCLQTVCYLNADKTHIRGWERGNKWPKFSVILLTLKAYHFQLLLRSLNFVWKLSLTASSLSFSEYRYVTSIVQRCFYHIHMRLVRTVRKSFFHV